MLVPTTNRRRRTELVKTGYCQPLIPCPFVLALRFRNLLTYANQQPVLIRYSTDRVVRTTDEFYAQQMQGQQGVLLQPPLVSVCRT